MFPYIQKAQNWANNETNPNQDHGDPRDKVCSKLIWVMSDQRRKTYRLCPLWVWEERSWKVVLC